MGHGALKIPEAILRAQALLKDLDREAVLRFANEVEALSSEARATRPSPDSEDEDRLLLGFMRITTSATQVFGEAWGQLLQMGVGFMRDDVRGRSLRAAPRRKLALRQLAFAMNTFELLGEFSAEATASKGSELPAALTPRLKTASTFRDLGPVPPLIRNLLRFELNVFVATSSDEDDDLEFFAARSMAGAQQLAPHLEQLFLELRLTLLAARMEELSKETAAAGWDFEGGVAIPAEEWRSATNLCARIAVALPSLPLPTPSPCGDGTIHLRWSRGTTNVVVELRGDNVWWTRVAGAARTSGELSSRDDVPRLLAETFG